MQRTIAEAKRLLEDYAPTLNRPVYDEREAQVVAAERDATTRATAYVADRYGQAAPAGNEAVKDLCSVRDDAAALAAAVTAGRLTSREALEQLTDLRARHRRLVRISTAVQDHADVIAAIEDNPIGWADSLAERFPHMRPDFDF